jgi:hypothetical protein
MSKPGAILVLLALACAAAAQAQEAPAEPRVQPVIDKAQVSDIERQLQRGLDRLGGGAAITRCGPVLGLITPQSGGYDRSYGASCELKLAERTTTALMCDDARGARFTLSLAAVPDIDSMRRFILGNCFTAP